MSKCVFCGREAGLLQKKHKACEEKHDQGQRRVLELAMSAMKDPAQIDSLNSTTRSLAAESFISEAKRQDILAFVFNEAVTEFLSDGVLTAEEEGMLTNYGERLSLTPKDLDSHGGYTSMVQGGLLRDLTEGKIPTRMNVGGELPFILQKNDFMVWLFKDVEYHEVRTRTRYVGGSSGVSLRIARGVYYRLGGFAAQPVRTEETVRIGAGVMLLTTKNVYFGSRLKSVRIPYNKIVSITPYSDGVGIQRDAVSAKPPLFINGSGWFTYNLLMNLSHRQPGA